MVVFFQQMIEKRKHVHVARESGEIVHPGDPAPSLDDSCQWLPSHQHGLVHLRLRASKLGELLLESDNLLEPLGSGNGT